MSATVQHRAVLRLAHVGVACLLAVWLAAPAAEAASRIYRTVDENGNVVFTDVPPRPGEPGEAVELGQSSTYTSPPTPDPGDPTQIRLEDWLGETAAEDDAATETAYRSLHIVAPADDEGLRDNAGNVTVAAELTPDLRPGHALELYMDGALAQRIRGGSTFQLSNVDRGTHTIDVRVVDGAGATLIRSDAITFHLQRRSVLMQPGAQRPRPGN